MNKWIVSGLLLLLVVLTGCTTTIYGVSQERWDTMGEQERVAAMEAYRARQAVLLQQRQERARLQALEREQQRAIEAAEARQRQMRIDAIYRGEGVYGDLLRVTLRGGRLKFLGAHRPYQPVAFRIAAGETKRVEVVDDGGRRRVAMVASYDGSILLLDDSPGARRSRATRLVYEDLWEEGKTYPNLVAKGPLELRGVNVTVQVLGEPPRDRRARRRQQVIVIRQPAPQPERPRVVIVEEKERRPRRPETTIVREAPRSEKPEVVVVREQPRPEEPEVILVGKQPRPDRQVPVAADPPRPEKPDVAAKEPPARKGQAGAPPVRVKVTFQKGKIRIRGKSYPFTPQSLDLNEGESRTIVLRSQPGKLRVRVSYRGGVVAIDDQPGRGNSTTRLDFGQGWRDGSTSRIKATGNRLIEDLDISVLAM